MHHWEGAHLVRAQWDSFLLHPLTASILKVRAPQRPHRRFPPPESTPRATVPTPEQRRRLLATENVYRRLQQHIDNMPVGYPATESGVELRLLQHLLRRRRRK